MPCNGFSITGNTINANGAYAGTNYGGCTAQPLVVSAGDSVAVGGNTYGPFANLLGGCESFTALLRSSGLAAVRSGIATSAEARNAIDAAYVRVLGRPADPTGMDGNVNALAAGSVTMAQLPVNLMRSAEALADPYRSY